MPQGQPVKGRRANRPKARKVSSASSIADLQKQVHALSRELKEAREQQNATADVLKTISRSSIELETVLDTLVETVARLCRADTAAMYRRQDERYHPVASRGLSEEAEDFLLAHP